MADKWEKLKQEAGIYYKEGNLDSAIERDVLSLKELQLGKEYEKIEASKILSNLSLMYFQRYKKDEENIHLKYAIKYAEESINSSPSWHKGYLRLAECYKIQNDIDSVIDTLKSYLEKVDDPFEIPKEFQEYMASVKYYTHKKVLMASEIWGDIEYPENVVVIDQNGAGHFNCLSSFLQPVVPMKDVSIIILPGLYVGTYDIVHSSLQIIGYKKVKEFHDNDAIKQDPCAIFVNAINQITIENCFQQPHVKVGPFVEEPTTFSIYSSHVDMKNILVQDNVLFHPTNAVVSSESKLTISYSSFFSKCSAALVANKGSSVMVENCKSVGAFSAILSADNTTCHVANSYISKTVGLGIEIRSENYSASLRNCIITDCEKQGVCVYNGAKAIKIRDCQFFNNATKTPGHEGSIQLKNCKADIKNTLIKDNKSVGIVIESGYGKFKNIKIQNCLTGMLIQAPCFIKESLFMDCPCAINLCNNIKGVVELVDNNMINCWSEVNQGEKETKIVFSGSIKNKVNHWYFDSAKAMLKSKAFKEHIKSRNKPTGVDIGPVGDVLGVNKDNLRKHCQYCGLSPYQQQKVFQFCGRCKKALYCSTECQTKDWKFHKIHCDSLVRAKEEIAKQASRKTNPFEKDLSTKVKQACNEGKNGNQSDIEKPSASAEPEWKRKKKKKKKPKHVF